MRGFVLAPLYHCPFNPKIFQFTNELDYKDMTA